MFPINFLTAAHRDNYLQPVAIRQLLCGKHAARHDLAVAFKCNALAGETQLFDKLCNAGGAGKLARCAVNADGNHFKLSAKLEEVR